MVFKVKLNWIQTFNKEDVEQAANHRRGQSYTGSYKVIRTLFCYRHS